MCICKLCRPEPTQAGWICPACGKGNAPWKGACDCAGAVEEPSDNTGGPLKHGVDPTGAIKITRGPVERYTIDNWAPGDAKNRMTSDDFLRAVMDRGIMIRGE